jgi:hypothetical protein
MGFFDSELARAIALAAFTTGLALLSAIWMARLRRVDDVPKLTYAGLKMLLEQREWDNRRLRRINRLLERRVVRVQEAYRDATGDFISFDDGAEWDEIDSLS